MKILIAAHSFAPEITGVSRVSGIIASGFLSRGHGVTVVTWGQDRESEKTEDGLEVERFNCTGNWVDGIHGDFLSYRRFVLQHPADIVVFHCAQTWTTDALLGDWDRLGKPVVLVSHGLSAYKNKAFGAYFALLGRKLNINGHVVGLSQRLEEVSFCADNGLLPPTIIPNGVNIAEWVGETRNMREGWGIGERPWVVTVSNHSTVKNHGAFWRVLDRLAETIPVIQGSIIGRPYRAARFRSGRIGVKGGCWYGCNFRRLFSNRVLLHDRAKREEVVSAVKEADLLLVTSFREAAPLVILESMAAGIPWVSFRVGSVEDNAGGLVVDTESEMVAAAAQMLSDPEAAHMLGRTGRDRVRECHDWEKIIDAHAALYQRCIESRRGGL